MIIFISHHRHVELGASFTEPHVLMLLLYVHIFVTNQF